MGKKSDEFHTCYDCTACQEEKAWAERTNKILESWNWNARPRTVAREIKELVKSGHFSSEDEALDEMKAYGFNDSDISSVVWELDGEV